VNNLKKFLGLIPVALFAFMLGCGGGGSGGGSTGSTSSTTGFTSGATNADPGSTILGQAVHRAVQGVNAPVVGVTIRFYTSGGTLVGAAVSRANGYFDANIPTTATRFEVDRSTIPNSASKQYRYDGQIYQGVGDGVTCNRVLLPPLADGVLTNMEGALLFGLNTDPPPFPAGCF
jgi:hypothetical protein